MGSNLHVDDQGFIDEEPENQRENRCSYEHDGRCPKKIHTALSAEIMAGAFAGQDGALQFANRLMHQLWGCRHDRELLGSSLYDLFGSTPGLQLLFDELRENGRYSGDTLAFTRQGAPLHLHMKARVVTDHEGNEVGLVTVFFDISSRKKLERQRDEQIARASASNASYLRVMADLAKSNNALKEEIVRGKLLEEDLRVAQSDANVASEAKSLFVAKMSHEVRSPLTAILGYTDLLLEKGWSGDDERLLTKVRNAGAGLLGIVDDILDISKIEAGRLDITTLPFSMQEIVDQAAAITSLAAERKGLKFVTEVASQLSMTLLGDEARVRQILVNLLSNAVKFTQEGTVELDVSLAGDIKLDEPVRARITVRDSGIGIEKKDLKNIFKPFDQGCASTARHFGGTGLGLAVVDQLVSHMGGRISVESALGFGTIFVIELPFDQTPLDARGCTKSRSKHSAQGEGHSVLLVDDRQDVLELGQSQLARRGFSVLIAHDGQEALDVLDRNRDVRAVLMDLDMPIMNGLAATRQLKGDSTTAHVPVIMTTACCTTAERDACFEAGCDAYLSKPIDWDAVTELVLEELPIMRKKTAPVEASAVSRPSQVLVVDDSEDDLDYISRILGLINVQGTLCKDPEEALVEVSKGQGYDLVLIDKVMPGLDGPELAQRLRSDGYNNPLVIMTASVDRAEHATCLEAGCDELVVKPLRPDDVITLISKYVREGADDGRRDGSRH